MIIYNKLYKKDRQDFISFVNDKGWEVSIPIDFFHANRIALYLEQIGGTSNPVNIQENNLKEESEEDI
jgi:hypothetical protein